MFIQIEPTPNSETLTKMGIENMLKYSVSEVKVVMETNV